MEEEPEQLCIKPEIEYLKIDIEEESSLDVEVKIERDYTSDNEITKDLYKTNPASLMETELTQKVYSNGKTNRINCPICENSFKNRANLKNHLKFVHATESDEVECKTCCRTFKSIAHLRTHISSVHLTDTEVTCNYCQKTFCNRKKLNNHIYCAHPSPNEQASCPICKKTYKSAYNLRIHIRQVHPSGEQSVTCNVCTKTFKNETLLQRHVKWSHPADNMMYRCPQCGRMLPSILCYRKHIQNVHSNIAHTCKICSKSFKTEQTLARHEKTVHEGIKPEPKQHKVGDLKCTQCDKFFTTNTALFWHYDRSHSENKRDTTCLLCSKELSDYAGMKRHIEMCHSLQTATCHICNKEFKSYINLQRHVRVTHAPPEEEIMCDICKKPFKCAMHLRIHINSVHPKDGSYNCDICNKEFTSKKYMVKHRKTHTAIKEFPCPLCNKYFKSKGDVTKHKKRVHVNIETIKEEILD